jgi:hypothetical protein
MGSHARSENSTMAPRSSWWNARIIASAATATRRVTPAVPGSCESSPQSKEEWTHTAPVVAREAVRDRRGWSVSRRQG